MHILAADLHVVGVLTLYQPMTRICVRSSHKPIRIYMGGLILGVNALYRLSFFFKLFPMVGKGLKSDCLGVYIWFPLLAVNLSL